MSGLRDRAAEQARGLNVPTSTEPSPSPLVRPATGPEPLPDVEVAEPGPDGPEQVPVHVAWSRVMGTVGNVAKSKQVTEGPRFNYRGVDQALNVFGPACRLHGVIVLPVRVEASYRDTKTSTGKTTRECTVVVAYRIYGPTGDHIEVQAAGESLDSGDKGSAKAQSVALRTLLFHGGLVPTGDPDPDAVNIERGEAVIRPAASYRDELLDRGTSRERFAQVRKELLTHRRAGELVTNEVGDEEQIVALLDRVGKERFASGGGE